MLSLIGPSSLRVGQKIMVLLTAYNPSNANVERAVVWIEFPDDVELVPDTDSLFPDDPQWDPNDNYLLDDDGHRILPLYFYNISAGQTKIVRMALKLSHAGNNIFSIKTQVMSTQQFEDNIREWILGVYRPIDVPGVQSEQIIQQQSNDPCEWAKEWGPDVYNACRLHNDTLDAIGDIGGIMGPAFGMIKNYLTGNLPGLLKDGDDFLIHLELNS